MATTLSRKNTWCNSKVPSLACICTMETFKDYIIRFLKNYLKCSHLWKFSQFLQYLLLKNHISREIYQQKKYYNWHVYIYNYFKTLISNPLASIFNDCLFNGTFPTKFKIARVTPIHRKGKQNDVNNYRRISVLPIFSKLLEKCIYKRIIYFLDKHNILIKHKFGFRRGHSTATAILDLIHKINQAIDNKEYALTIFIDLTKALDVIDHLILLRKLQY